MPLNLSASNLSPQAASRELDLICLELARRQLHEQIRYFQPHGGQVEFLKLIAEPGAFLVVTGAGNGWGKSELLVAIYAAVMWPMLAAPCFSADIFQKWPYPKRARLASTPKELEDIGSIQVAIKKYFPKGRYTLRNKGKNYPVEFKTDTGWTFDLFSYEQDAGEYAGPNLGLQGYNEPPPYEIHKEAIWRTRAGGVILGSMTSLNQNPWVVSGIFGKTNGKDVRTRFGDVEENCKTHGTNGNLEHAAIERMLEAMSDDPVEREARKTGRPLSLSGAIFRSFDYNVHVLPDEPQIPSDVTHYMSCDPAGSKPLAMLWGWVNGAGTIVIYDEYPDGPFLNAKDKGTGVSEYVEIIRAREMGRAIEERIIDARYANATHTPGALPLKEQFSNLGLYFSDSYKVAADQQEVETGIFRVLDLLRYDKQKPIDALNAPRLLISPKCKNLIASLRFWTRDPKTGKPKDDGYKDHADALRYLVMANPQHSAPREITLQRRASYGVNQG